MSLQDDIFDVAAALEGTPEAKAFDSICETFFRWERERDACLGVLVRIKAAQDTMRAFIALDIPEPPVE